MPKFVPYKKMSKRMKRKLDSERRADWGAVNPVSRVTKNAKAYNRQNLDRPRVEEE